uniref:Tellurium resistance protein TerD n=1 Tax=Candidatus Kentrum sp. SD TaxID=2126332 RepID=A0A451BPC1_9GAMM|nr:MAG: tellurium resistance protein TerD [Candidatus Kentron sp. SD]
MAVSLEKGGRISLSKEAPGLSRVFVGLGWDERATDGADFDLDASAFLLKDDGKVRSEADFVFYNNLTAIDGAIAHQGDNLTGGGEGDDEVVKIDLKKVETNAPEIGKIAFVVTIHEAEARKQNFGQVANAFIRVVNDDSGQELVRFDLTEDYSTETAMNFGEIYKKDGEWRFAAVGQGYSGGLAATCHSFGINAA